LSGFEAHLTIRKCSLTLVHDNPALESTFGFSKLNNYLLS